MAVTLDKCGCYPETKTKTFYLRSTRTSASDQELVVRKTKTTCQPKQYEPQLKWICDDAKMSAIQQQMATM